MTKFNSIRLFSLTLISIAVLLGACKKDDPEPEQPKPLTIVKITPALKTVFATAGQTIIIEFSDKINFSLSNRAAYIKYWESDLSGTSPVIYSEGGFITPKQENTYSFDGNKTITIKMGNSFKAGVAIGWQFPTGMIKTPDGRVLPDDGSGMGYWIDYTFKK